MSDARGALKRFLQLGFEPACEPLFDEAATGDALRRLVTDDLAVLDPEDSLVLFFAGHGHTVTQTFPGIRSAERKQGYIVPVDGDLPGGRAGTWVRLDSWLSDVTHLPVKHLLVILDACHSGIALEPTVPVVRWRGVDADLPRSLIELQARRSRRIITSARDDQLAMDSGPVPDHSLFTGCLIEALTDGLVAVTGESVVTGTEIGCYVQRRVIDFPSSRQSPELGPLELDDRGELVVRLSTDVDGAPKRRRDRSGLTRRSRRPSAAVRALGVLVGAVVIAALSRIGAMNKEDPAQPAIPKETRDASADDASVTDPPIPQRLDAAATAAPDASVSPPPDAAPDLRDAWLARPVSGADNVTAPEGLVRITRSGRGYRIWIEKGLGFICSLEFGEAGNPEALVGCVANSPFWKVFPHRIPMTCRADPSKRRMHCSARYGLQGSSYASDAELWISRDLNPNETASSPR